MTGGEKRKKMNVIRCELDFYTFQSIRSFRRHFINKHPRVITRNMWEQIEQKYGIEMETTEGIIA